MALKSFFQNTRKPRDSFSGRLMMKMMNKGHQQMAKWSLQFLDGQGMEQILDIGCGGGRNMKNLHGIVPEAKIWGLDYSESAVEASRKYNRKAIASGTMEVYHGDVRTLPFEDGFFDAMTAFETVYFWPGPQESFMEVFRALKPGGLFFIANEASQMEGNEHWVNMIDMRIYNAEELEQHLSAVGFKDVGIHHHENGKWMCVLAIKP